MAISISAQSPTFTIQDPPSVTLTSPDSGSFAHNQNISIQWSKSNFTENVDLYFTSSTTFSTSNAIVTNQSGTSYTWNVPESLGGSSIYIWVRKTGDSSVKDRSNNAVSITVVNYNWTATDATQFSQDNVNSTKTTFKTVKNTSDATHFSVDGVQTATRTWKINQTASDATQFSTDTVSDSKRTWKYINNASDASAFTENVADSKRTWKYINIASDATQFSADTVNSAKRTWKYINTAVDALQFAEQVSFFITKSLPSANDTTQFIEDVVAAIAKNSNVRQFTDSATESFAASYKTGWIPVSKDLDKNSMIRRVNFEYHSADPINVRVYTDGDSTNPVYTNTLAAATNKQTTNKSLRVGRRAKYLMIEMSTNASTNSNTSIEDLEVQVDG
jgi:hypothetical protein